MRDIIRRPNIYDKIGFSGLVHVVWKSTPYPPHIKFIAVPYGLWVYRYILQKSPNLTELQYFHSRKFEESKLFRRIRPQYSIAKGVLEGAPYKIK